jgi:hypothetical protein
MNYFFGSLGKKAVKIPIASVQHPIVCNWKTANKIINCGHQKAAPNEVKALEENSLLKGMRKIRTMVLVGQS